MEKTPSNGRHGLRRAGAWLLGFLWLGLVLAGMAIAFTPSPHSPAIGWGLLALAGTIALASIDWWAKIFPGLLAYGIVGSVLSLVDGHAVNHPEVPVSRLEGALMAVFFTVATVLSFTFTRRKLHPSDRVALFAFVVCFFWQAVAPRIMWVALGVGFCSLLFAWLYDHFRYRRNHTSPFESHLWAQ
jgi:hypothetical protein